MKDTPSEDEDHDVVSWGRSDRTHREGPRRGGGTLDAWVRVLLSEICEENTKWKTETFSSTAFPLLMLMVP